MAPSMSAGRLEAEIEARVEGLGFELVEFEMAGSRSRPILRLRIDRAGSVPGEGITVDECAAVSRELEPFLEEAADVPERYVLEVSSPGVERPLVRPRDWRRFAGRPVVVKGRAELAGRGKRIEGELLGLVEERAEGEERARLRLADGEEVEIPLEEVARANLVFRWEDAR